MIISDRNLQCSQLSLFLLCACERVFNTVRSITAVRLRLPATSRKSITSQGGNQTGVTGRNHAYTAV